MLASSVPVKDPLRTLLPRYLEMPLLVLWWIHGMNAQPAVRGGCTQKERFTNTVSSWSAKRNEDVARVATFERWLPSITPSRFRAEIELRYPPHPWVSRRSCTSGCTPLPTR